jgi:LmbE family N-acetylglucosaminyl deacetylase
MAPPVALGLFAHPDDETLACGGTLAALVDDGWTVHVVFVGDGRITARPGGQDNQADAVAACAVLGVGEPGFLGFPDQRLDTVAIADLVNAAKDAVPEPDLVVANSAADLNADHRIVSHVARVLARPVGRRIALIEAGVPGGAAHHGVGVATPWYSDITATLDRKLEALACYRGEARAWPHPRSPEAVEALARTVGAESGLGLAEGFTLVRGYRGGPP